MDSQALTQAISVALQPLVERVERLESTSSPRLASSIVCTANPAFGDGGVPSNSQPSSTYPAPAAQVSALPASSRTPRSNLPHVPARIRDRITRGEFVDFDNLLPDVVGADLEEEDVVQLSMQSGWPVQLVHKSPSHTTPRRRVHDIATWLEAFTVYMRVVLDTTPEKVHCLLLAYQAAILEANNNYHKLTHG